MKRLLPSILILFLASCVTSPAFKSGVSALSPHLTHEAQSYLAADKTLNGPTRALRQRQLDSLIAACTAPISRISAQEAWPAVKGWLSAYYQSDVTLDDVERQNRMNQVGQMDLLIVNDRNRPLSGGK